MSLSKYLVGFGAIALTVSACGSTEKIVYMPTPEAQYASTQPPQTYAPSLSSSEKNFLSDVDDLYEGVIYVEDQLMIDAAYETCRLFRDGMTLQDVIDVLNESAQGDPDVYELLSSVVVAAVFNFCPEQEYRFTGSNA